MGDNKGKKQREKLQKQKDRKKDEAARVKKEKNHKAPSPLAG